MYTTRNLVMLPSNKEANLYDIVKSLRYPDKIKEFATFENSYVEECKVQHLYVISDEEIKERDLCYNSQRKSIELGKHMINTCEFIFCKKIIATTDTSLKINHFNKGVFKNLEYSIPQPSQEFIEAYVKAYNEGNPITEVIVEYEIICGRCYSNTDECWSAKECSRNTDFPDIVKLKVNSGNTINIKLIKDRWSRKEVIEVINKFSYENCDDAYRNNDKWIEENL